jgi:hypothetical protein
MFFFRPTQDWQNQSTDQDVYCRTSEPNDSGQPTRCPIPMAVQFLKSGLPGEAGDKPNDGKSHQRALCVKLGNKCHFLRLLNASRLVAIVS